MGIPAKVILASLDPLDATTTTNSSDSGRDSYSAQQLNEHGLQVAVEAWKRQQFQNELQQSYAAIVHQNYNPIGCVADSALLQAQAQIQYLRYYIDTQLVHLRQELTALNTRADLIAATNADNARLQQSVQQLINEKASLNQSIQALTASNKSLSEQSEQLKITNANKEVEIERLLNKNNKLFTANQRLSKKIEQQKNSLPQQQHNELIAKNSELESDLKKTTLSNSELKANNAKLLTDNSFLQSEITRLNDQLKNAVSPIPAIPILQIPSSTHPFDAFNPLEKHASITNVGSNATTCTAFAATPMETFSASSNAPITSIVATDPRYKDPMKNGFVMFALKRKPEANSGPRELSTKNATVPSVDDASKRLKLGQH